MKKLYLAAPITSADIELKKQIRIIVDDLIDSGIDVLDEFVKGNDLNEILDIIERRTGVRRDKAPDPHLVTYQQDTGWLKEATHFVALVDNPSHGVGMEIMFVKLRPLLGLNPIPAMLLVKSGNIEKVSSLVKGCVSDNPENFCLQEYKSPEVCAKLIKEFLDKSN